jgi:hypothetical protein
MKTLNKKEKISVMKARVALMWSGHMQEGEHIPESPTSLNLTASDNCAECEGYRAMTDAVEALKAN